MSTRTPRSRSIDRRDLVQDVMPPIEVAALFHEPAIQEVHLATDQLGQFLLDLEPVEILGVPSWLEADQEVHVAFRAKVFAHSPTPSPAALRSCARADPRCGGGRGGTRLPPLGAWRGRGGSSGGPCGGSRARRGWLRPCGGLRRSSPGRRR